MFDYIVNAVKRTGPSIEITDDDDMATREDFNSWEWLVLNVCEVQIFPFQGPAVLLYQPCFDTDPQSGGIVWTGRQDPLPEEPCQFPLWWQF